MCVDLRLERRAISAYCMAEEILLGIRVPKRTPGWSNNPSGHQGPEAETADGANKA